MEDLSSIFEIEANGVFPGSELEMQDYKINVEKLREFFPIKTSREYIEKYLRENL